MPARAVAPLSAELAQRSGPVKIAMLSPYALSRVGGVQGQVVGLSRALGTMGHDVTVLGPSDRGAALPTGLGPHYVFGHCTGVRANGSGGPAPPPPPGAPPAGRSPR